MPTGVTRHEVSFEGPNGPMRAWILRPEDRAPSGRLFVIHGLHFLGPEDPRLLRFLSAVAASGVEVFAPFIPTLLSLSLDEASVAETEAALRAATADPSDGPIGLFTISFGSILGVRMMLTPEFQEKTEALMVFGGFCDWKDALRYSITDRDTRADVVPPDPLNQPAIYMNLVADMEAAPEQTHRVHDAWLAYIKATWGDPTMRDRARFEPIARRLSQTLEEEERALFLRGCGLAPGAREEVEGALVRANARLNWLDPQAHLARLRCPLYIAHGADDDVVPVHHAEAMASAATSCPRVTQAVTGLYGHTEHVGLSGLLKRGPEAFRELRTMMGLLRAIVSVSHPSQAHSSPVRYSS